MRFRRTLTLGLLLGVGAPAPALADGLIVPFIGVNFAGNSGRQFSRAIDAKRLDWGASFAFMGAGYWASRQTSHTARISSAEQISAVAAC